MQERQSQDGAQTTVSDSRFFHDAQNADKSRTRHATAVLWKGSSVNGYVFAGSPVYVGLRSASCSSFVTVHPLGGSATSCMHVLVCTPVPVPVFSGFFSAVPAASFSAALSFRRFT